MTRASLVWSGGWLDMSSLTEKLCAMECVTVHETPFFSLSRLIFCKWIAATSMVLRALGATRCSLFRAFMSGATWCLYLMADTCAVRGARARSEREPPKNIETERRTSGQKNTLIPVNWGYFRPRRIRIWGRKIPEPFVLFAKSKIKILPKISIRCIVTHKNHQWS